MAKTLEEQSETQRLMVKARDHHATKKAEEEIVRLEKEIDNKPTEATLDVMVDGEQVGHMVLKSGGEYDLNLKSSDLAKKEDPKTLVDDGSKITSEKKKAESDEAVDAVAKEISGSLRDFAQTHINSFA